MNQFEKMKQLEKMALTAMITFFISAGLGTVGGCNLGMYLGKQLERQHLVKQFAYRTTETPCNTLCPVPDETFTTYFADFNDDGIDDFVFQESCYTRSVQRPSRFKEVQ